jgi:hypothetical protein
MEPDYTRIWPYLFATLAVFAVYRRLRRSFGRQPLHPVRMRVRMGLLAIIGCLVLPTTLRSAAFMSSAVLGLAAGVGLAIFGAARTRYQRVDDRLFYIPHTYTGVLVSLLFVGRLVYRMVTLSSGIPGAGMAGGGDMGRNGFDPMIGSPVTLGFLFVLVGYYVFYYGRVLWKVKHIAPEDLEVEATSSASSI